MRKHRATPKSIRTRTAIENAARELFAAHGFEGTTVRDIATRAHIDVSMIIAYFGSKDALFALVAQPHPPDFSGVKPNKIGEAMVRHLLDQWEGEGVDRGFPVLLRSAASNEQAAGKLREILLTQFFPAIARLGPSETASIRAGLVASQLLGFALARYVLRIPPLVDMPADLIIRTIGKTAQRYAVGKALTNEG
jgi:AcrR family transcriptional regulator